MKTIPSVAEKTVRDIQPGSLVRMGDALGFIVKTQDDSHCFVKFDINEKHFTYEVLQASQSALDLGRNYVLELDLTQRAFRETPGLTAGTTLFWKDGKPTFLVHIPAAGDWLMLDLDAGEFLAKDFNGMTACRNWRIGIHNADGRFAPLIAPI